MSRERANVAFRSEPSRNGRWSRGKLTEAGGLQWRHHSKWPYLPAELHGFVGMPLVARGPLLSDEVLAGGVRILA